MSWRDKIAAVLAGKVGGPTPTGIHVYHSSPHDFTRFENRLLTGEGANVYGAGTYLAENPAVSGQGGQYWNQFIGRRAPVETEAADALRSAGFDRAAAAAEMRKRIDEIAAKMKTEGGWDAMQARQHEALKLIESGAPVGPRTYEVNFKAKPEELLDWDKALKDQAPVAASIAGSRNPIVRDVLNRAAAGDSTGQNIYQMMAFDFGRHKGAERASQELRDAGIPGIRYLDEGSRNINGRLAAIQNTGDGYYVAGKGQFKDFDAAKAALGITPPTHNYVAFDPSRLDIMAKYGVVGGVPLGAATMGGTIDQSTYGDRQ